MTLAEFVVDYVFHVDEKSKSGAEAAVNKFAGFAKSALGAIGIGFSLIKLNAISEEFRTINAGIKNATDGLGDQLDIQNRIMKSATAARGEYATMAKMVGNLMQESPDLFGDVDEAAKYTETITKLFKTAGKSDDVIAGLMESINKSFAKGYVDSETISQLLEQSPEAIQLLNEKFNTTSDKLEQLVADGRITVKDLKDVFGENADAIDAKFAATSGNITGAIKSIRQQWGLYVAQLDTGAEVGATTSRLILRGFNGIMAILKKLQPMIERGLKTMVNMAVKTSDFLDKIGTVLGRMVKRVGGVENAVKLLGVAAAALFLYFNFNKIIGGFSALSKLFNPVAFKIMLIAGAIAAVILILEDFYHFMKGDDSLIGKAFESAGMDADAARQKIKDAWNDAKQVLLGIWEKLKSAGETILGSLQAFWSQWGDEILAVVSYLFRAIVGMIGPLIDAIAAFIGMFVALITGDFASANKYAEDLGQAAIDAIMSWWNALPEGVRDDIMKIVTNIKSGFQQAIDWLQGLPAQAKKWGEDFIDGLADGIETKINAVVEKVKGLGDQIRAFLHFSRPDKGPLRDYEGWMPDFMKGLAAGIDEYSPGVIAALKRMTNGMALVYQNAAPMPRTAYASVNRSSKSIVQNNTFTNTYSGSRDMQRTASKAMKRSTSDATQQLAEALKYC